MTKKPRQPRKCRDKHNFLPVHYDLMAILDRPTRISVKDIAAKVGVSRNIVIERLKELIYLGLLTRTISGRGREPYTYRRTNKIMPRRTWIMSRDAKTKQNTSNLVQGLRSARDKARAEVKQLKEQLAMRQLPESIDARFRTVVEDMQTQIDNLEMQVCNLKEILAIEDKPVLLSKLTRVEERVYGALRVGKIITREMIYDAMYFDKPGDPPEVKIVDVFLTRIRIKLRAERADGWIQTIWGRGYCLHRVDKSFWDRVPDLRGQNYTTMTPEEALEHGTAWKEEEAQRLAADEPLSPPAGQGNTGVTA